MVYTAKDDRWQHLMETASRDYSYDRMYIDEFDHFVQALAGGTPYTRDFRDVQRLLECRHRCGTERHTGATHRPDALNGGTPDGGPRPMTAATSQSAS